jgi:hypothetical protein
LNADFRRGKFDDNFAYWSGVFARVLMDFVISFWWVGGHLVDSFVAGFLSNTPIFLGV